MGWRWCEGEWSGECGDILFKGVGVSSDHRTASAFGMPNFPTQQRREWGGKGRDACRALHTLTAYNCRLIAHPRAALHYFSPVTFPGPIIRRRPEPAW
jgi:hypothetical protein